jgi:DNA polymerase V
LEEIAPAKQNICTAKSFGVPLETLEQLQEPLASYVSRVAEKLRGQGSVAGRIQVFLETNPFQPQEPQYSNSAGLTLLTPSSFTPDLVTAGMGLLQRIYRPGYRYKRVGVMLLDLGSEQVIQASFDEPPPELSEKRRRAMSALDTVNQSFGRGAVRVGSAAAPDPRWKMRQTRLSPRWTTRWADLPVAAA